MSTTDFPNDPGAARGSTQGGEGNAAGGAGAKEQARQAAGTAAEQGQHVAGVAQQEVGNVVSEARTQLSSLLDDATSQVGEQSRSQKDRLAETARTFGSDLQKLGSGEGGGDGVAAKFVQQLAQQAQSLASHLENREPAELLEDARRFARRRPGTFLLGSLAAGVVVGRVTRGAKAASQSGGNNMRSTPPAVQTTTVDSGVGGMVTSAGAPAGAGVGGHADLANAGVGTGVGTGVDDTIVELPESGVTGTSVPRGGGRP
jgi:hypothetical protein